jgi:hypothetical protein
VSGVLGRRYRGRTSHVSPAGLVSVSASLLVRPSFFLARITKPSSSLKIHDFSWTWKLYNFLLVCLSAR